MIQRYFVANGVSVPSRWYGLNVVSSVGRHSGVTPGIAGKLCFRRVSAAAPEAQNRSRRVRLVGTLRRRCSDMTSVADCVSVLSRAFAAGAQDVQALVHRGVLATGWPAAKIEPIAQRVASASAGQPRPRARDINALLKRDWPWLLMRLGDPTKRLLKPRDEWLHETAAMRPTASAVSWSLPLITTVSALAEWLELSVAELAWFGNAAAIGQSDIGAPRHHYHYIVRRKPQGGVRLLEAPQRKLKQVQRRILAEILEQVPPYCTAAHGFVKGRSVRTFATEHVGRAVVLRMDLAEFFPRISGARVQAVFRTLGYPEPVAEVLGSLCTNTVPASVFLSRRYPLIHPTDLRNAQRLYARPHLPQGAPTSPALANLCAFRLDARLTGLADWAGAVYSRYADDLAFSGDAIVARRIARYSSEIAAIARDEGWHVQHHKTRIMRQSVQQRLTGLVVNTRVNVPRSEVDQLRAILTNCVRHGPAGQNRDLVPDFRAYLRGRIAWVRSVNAGKGERLQGIYERVVWGE
jgi:RNA-directed DNA polymerase